MKRYLSMVLICALTGACANNAPPRVSAAELEQYRAAVKADVDLSELSSTVVIAEITNILSNPDGYMGKIIRVSGAYSPLYIDITDKFYHYVLVDPCCAGMEFMWNGEHKYPNDYPADSDVIEVAGVFGSYDELGITYYYLAVDDILVKE